MEKQIICINWGTKYGASYINRLYAMVARHTTPPFTFYCFTDSRDGVRSEIQCRDLPPLPAEMPTRTPGQWPKSRLWSAELADLSGPVLFLDLDLIVTGSLDPFFEFGAPDDVILARNVAKPLERLGQTSIFRFPVGKLEPVQRIFAADPQGTADRFRYEQHFVTRTAPGGVSFWPRGWVRHFRIECIPPFPLNFFRAPRVPKGARVVIFAGHVNPPDAIAGRWVSKEPHRPPLAHIWYMLRTGRGFRGARHFIWPSRWVADAWAEADRSASKPGQ